MQNKLNKVFIFFLVAICSLNFAFAKESSQNPKEYLSNLRQDASVYKFASKKKMEEILKNLEIENQKMSTYSSELTRLDSEIFSSIGLSEISKFNDNNAAALGAKVASYASANKLQNTKVNASNYAELLSEIEPILNSAINDVLNPLSFKDANVVDVKDNNFAGKTFKVGANTYFFNKDTAGFVNPDGVLYGVKYQKQIIDFASKKTNTLPYDFSNGLVFSAEKLERGIVEEIKLGGIWMYPILFFGLLSFVVCIVKIISFIKIRRLPKNTLECVFDELEKGDESKARTIANSAGYPYSNLLDDLISMRGLPAAKLEEISYESMLSAGDKLFYGLWVLTVTAAVSPLFGLLGTVTGIIKTFGDLSFQGAAQSQLISVGISEALLTTEYGLIVAIPAFVAHALFSRRAKAVVSDMEQLASGFVAKNSSSN